jgi:tetratricopeptide (TPR) repeat protein
MRSILLFCLLLSLCNCHPSGNQDMASNSHVSPPLPDILSDSNLYIADSVQSATNKSSITAALQGKKIFLKAIDLYRNQKNASASIELFRKSIRIYPDPKSYYELGNALMDIKDNKQSLDAYNIAIALKFAPVSMCYYNKACAYAQLSDTLSAIDQLSIALKQGYTDKRQLLDDPDLDPIRNTTQFRKMLRTNFKGKISKETLQFYSYLSVFPELGDSFAIKKEDVSILYNLAASISYDFADFVPGMENSQFSRSVSQEYQAIGKKALKNGLFLIAYSAIDIMGDTMLPVNTYLQTYDSTGKQIDNQLFSCFCDPQKIVSGSLDANQTLQITEYKQEWKMDPSDYGYAGNSVIKQEQVKATRFKVNDKGEFKALEAPLPVSARKN